MKDPQKFFPFPSYRKYQRKVLERFYQDWNSTQVFLLEAPPGFGKSAVNLALSSAVKRKALILCAQKVLLDQYERSFPNKIAVIKGRENYPCIAFEGYNCGNAPCCVRKKFRCPVEGDCIYKKKLELAKNFPITATTVAYGWQGGKLLLPRELIIVDEGHNIDTVVSNFVTFTITKKFWRKVHKELGSSTPFSILETLSSAEELAEYLIYNLDITGYINILQEKIEKSEKVLDGKELVKEYNHLASLINEAENKKEKILRFYSDVKKGQEWIVDKELQEGELVSICARPLYVGRFLKSQFWNETEKIVISSATICSPKIFLKEVGLGENYAVRRYRVPSSFPKDRRPIYVSYCGRMGRKHKTDTLPKIAKYIQEISNSYKEKVIVHSHSYENAKFLYKHLTGQVLFQGDDTREKMLEKFLNEPGPCIFLSVDMEEGIDLRDSLGRVNIIAKVPFPFLGDKKVERRMAEPDGQEWYVWKTVLTLCQAYGRTTRSKDDWSVTFILDSDFGFLFRRGKKLFPSWFTEALTTKSRWVRWDRCTLCKKEGKCVRYSNGWFLCKECWQVLLNRS